MKFFIAFISITLCTMSSFTQGLPIQNGELEKTSNNGFTFWTNQSIHGSNAIFGVVDNNEFFGSTKALRIQVNALGDYQYSVQTKSDHQFSMNANQKVTISFFAKATYDQEVPFLKLCLSDTSVGSSVFKQASFELTQNWKQYSYTFTTSVSVPSYQISFRYLNANSTYYLDEINAMPGNAISININERFQTIQGFGGGIKRRTDYLNDLSQTKRDIVEDLIYKDLKINMLRFFIHHSIENNQNDNDDPNLIDLNNTSWNYYTSGSFRVGETIQRAISKSEVGIDHLIGNCNSSPGWMKVNESHKRSSANEDVSLNTLKMGMEQEFSEYIEIFLKGLKQYFNIDVTEVSITNEPDFLNTYESMNLTPNELVNVIPVLRSRLDASSFASVNIVSPEAARVSPGVSDQLTAVNSAVSYIQQMFQDSATKSAVNVVATHTYYDSNHDANWSSLASEADGKPVWVTESANLKSLDFSIDDASDYIKWITRGFNEGGMTAYMVHLLFDKHIYATPEMGDKEGSSGLVVWDNSENVIIPKRYYAFKHFSTLSSKGFIRVSHTHTESDLYVTTFLHPNENQLVTHVFNSGVQAIPMTIEIPYNTSLIFRYTTDASLDFHKSEIDIINDHRYIEIDLTPKSINSFVFDFSESLLQQLKEVNPTKIFPNPTSGLIFFSETDVEVKCSVFSISGKKLFEQTVSNEKSLDLSILKKGLYFIQIQHRDSIQNFKVLLSL
ncbi:MAG: T9SS type A sorting domain-containing protein [Bacteroidota bacterium]|nr:T9SS type A sorting domain-containing protein [Bacteroidota bacterium]